jgi:hypothetical protein
MTVSTAVGGSRVDCQRRATPKGPSCMPLQTADFARKRSAAPRHVREPTRNAVLRLSGFAIGITPIAFGLASSLIRNYTRDAVFISRLARVDLGACRRGNSGCLLCGFCPHALQLLGFYTLPRGAPFFAGQGDRLPFSLPCELGRLCRFLCGVKGLKKSSLCIGSGAATIGKFIVSGILQISFPVISPGGQVRPSWPVSR